MSEKKYQTEWSFSFDDLGKKINETVNSLVGSEDVEIKLATFNANVDDATSANINLELGLGILHVSALAGDSNQLMTAEMDYIGEIDFEVSGEAEKVVHLAQKRNTRDVVGSIKRAVKSMSNHEELRTEIALSPNVPLKLNVDAGIAPSTLDLTELQLVSLDLDCGVGTMLLNLPESRENYRVSVDTGVGSTIVNAPANTNLHMDINGGVGSVRLNLPENVAARLTANSGIGGVNVPKYFVRVQKNDEFLSKGGVWETPGFAVADKQIFIDFNGGIGGFSVRVGDAQVEDEPKAKNKRKVKISVTHDDDESDINA